MNYYDLLVQQTERHPDKLFLVMDQHTFPYAKFLRLTDGVVRSAKEAGLRAGDDVLLFANNPVLQLAGFLALQHLVARPILAHKDMGPKDIADVQAVNDLQGVVEMGLQSLTFTPTHLPQRPHAEQDILGVLSSGSTGTPKVMYRTYESWAGFFPTQDEIFAVGGDTVMFLHGSLSFTGNTNSLLSVLYEGGTLVLLAEAMGGRTTFPDVCTMFTGSQLLTPPMIESILDILPNARLILYYGASELNYITYAVVEDPYRPPENLGRPFPGIRISIRDGLIYVDTKYHVSGAQIPFSVGDTGSINAQGELIFGGRKGAFVNRGGVKLNLLKLETVLRSLAGVREAAAIRTKHARRGEGIAVFLVRDTAMTEDEVRRTIRHALPAAEMPDRITFLDRMPLNDCGKIDREALNKRLSLPSS